MRKPAASNSDSLSSKALSSSLRRYSLRRVSSSSVDWCKGIWARFSSTYSISSLAESRSKLSVLRWYARTWSTRSNNALQLSKLTRTSSPSVVRMRWCWRWLFKSLKWTARKSVSKTLGVLGLAHTQIGNAWGTGAPPQSLSVCLVIVRRIHNGRKPSQLILKMLI